MTLDDLVASFYESGGCACRYPRFRAIVRRDTHNIAGAHLTTAEQNDLIALYLRRAEGRTACERCGSTLVHSRAEVELLIITKTAGLTELGAPVGSFVYRASSWLTPPPPTRAKFLDQAFPLLPFDEWIAWMRAPRAS